MRDEDVCVFCGYDLSGSAGEKHHFPVSRKRGGEATVAVCRSCHDLADRMPVHKWDASLAWKTFASLWDKAEPTQRIFLWKMFNTNPMYEAGGAGNK